MKKMAIFFIDHPVFAVVISAIVFLAGAISLLTLPITQYPSITPPEVTVKATYPGATALQLERAVAIPIEQSVNGVNKMLYFSSRSANDGSYALQCTFKPGTDPDLDALEVQNRVLQAEANLPPAVEQSGIDIRKRTPAMLAIVSLFSPTHAYDSLTVSNYAQIHILSPVTRINGIGDFEQHGRIYAMRVWLDPARMAALGVTASDVSQAISEQNLETPSGQIGMQPSSPGTQNQYTVSVNNELTSPEEYDNMILRRSPDGSILRLRNIGHAELGARSYDTFTNVNGHPGTSIVLYQLTNANALHTVSDIRQALKRVTSNLPPGMKYAVTMDSTLYIRQSLKEVIKTFAIALILVFAVVFLFLGNLRATLIPMMAVPVSLVGTLAMLKLLHFSLNLFSMFGLLLAIGLVIDDAIIVVEATERNIRNGMNSLDAAKQAMQEVSRAIMAVALVLSFVFIPIAFVPGFTGSLYRQISITIASAVLLSAFTALSLTPSMCAAILKPRKDKKGPLQWINRHFESGFNKLAGLYNAALPKLIGRWRWNTAVVLACCGLVYLFIRILPGGFIPNEDQGYFYLTITLPDGASMLQTEQVSNRAQQILLKQLPGVKYISTMGGYTYLEDTDQPNASTLVVALKPWGQRTGKGMDASSLMNRAVALLRDLPDAQVSPQGPAAVPGLGGASGFTLELQARRGQSMEQLVTEAHKLYLEALSRPELTGVYDTVRMDVPQVAVEIDRTKASSLGIPIRDIVDSLQMELGGAMINNFSRFGRIYKTMVQAEPNYRSDPDGIRNIYVRSRKGQMIPLSNVVKLTLSSGPNAVQRYDMYPNVEISGAAAQGYSSGQALTEMEALAHKLPPGYSFRWTGLAYQQRQAQGKSFPVFVLAIVLIFLILAAQFESWLTATPVMLAIPTGALGVYVAIWLHGLQNNVYTQVGLVTIIGLTAKNAVLIVEYARQSRDQGCSPQEAATQAAKLRFRPILMTSMAFILGMVPMLIASGAEATSRQTLGTAVMGGMVFATTLAIFVTPVAFTSAEGVRSRRNAKKADPPGSKPAEAEAA